MSYDLEPLKVPRIKGTALRALAALSEQPGVGGAIRAQMLSNLGFDVFRRAATDAEPASLPPVPDRSAQRTGRDSVDLKAVATATEPAPGFSFERIADFHQAYLSGKLSPVTVAQRLIETVRESERHEPALRLFIAQQTDDLMAQAEASAKRYEDGKPLSVLDGVPVPVKDEIDQRGYPTTVGTKFLGREPAAADAFCVAKMRATGALLPGKTNMHELGIGVTGLNPNHGSARNPYDPKCFTGGSSSGSAAVVAAGLAPLAIGADGGGSVRIPSSLCGVVGLKPTYGRISEQGAAPLCWSVAHIGPIAASARDVAVGYAVMAGVNPNDHLSMRQPDVTLEGLDNHDLTGVKLGVYRPWFEDAEPSVVKAAQETLSGLEERGAQVIDIDIEGLNVARMAHLVTIVSEMAASQLAHVAHRHEYNLDTRLNLALSKGLTASDYVHAQRHRRELSERFNELFTRVDGIVTPSTGCTSKPLPVDALDTGESNLELLGEIMRFAVIPNLTGDPAITFPAGYDERGMPVGLQVIGRAWEEALLLRLAVVAETFVTRQAPRWHRRLLVP